MWHRTIVGELESWAQFRTLFDARYKSDEILDAWEKELENKKQEGDVNDLALWMEDMFQRLDITSERKKNQVFCSRHES